MNTKKALIKKYRQLGGTGGNGFLYALSKGKLRILISAMELIK